MGRLTTSFGCSYGVTVTSSTGTTSARPSAATNVTAHAVRTAASRLTRVRSYREQRVGVAEPELLCERERGFDARPRGDAVRACVLAGEQWRGERVGGRVVVRESAERCDAQSREAIARVPPKPSEPVPPNLGGFTVGNGFLGCADDFRRCARE